MASAGGQLSFAMYTNLQLKVVIEIEPSGGSSYNSRRGSNLQASVLQLPIHLFVFGSAMLTRHVILRFSIDIEGAQQQQQQLCRATSRPTG